MATVKDIAEITGYSKATVSRVLNQDKSFSVSNEAREKIVQCVKDLNYVFKSRKNQEKKEKLSLRVGVVPIGLESTGRGELQDPYYLYIRNGIESRLEELEVTDVRNIPMNQEHDYSRLDELDGIIIIGKKKFDKENPYFKKLKYVVFVDFDFDSRRYDCILSDFNSAVHIALDYLMEKGYRSIGYMGSWDYVNDFAKGEMHRKVDSRQTAYEEYLTAKDMHGKKHIYIGEKFTASVGYELAKQAIASGSMPEAFLIGSDPMAMGVYRAFSERGIKIGSEIALVSIDGIDDTEYMNPPLTTIKVHSFQMGRSAVDCLIQQAQGRLIPVKLILPVNIIERKSV